MDIKGLNGKKFVGMIKVALLTYCSVAANEGINLFVNTDDTRLTMADMEQAVTNSKFTLVDKGQGQEIGLYRKDNGMELVSFHIDDIDKAAFDFNTIQKHEEYDKDHTRIAQRIALIDGVAFRETYDCISGDSMWFDPIESDNRNTFHALHGPGEIIDFVNVLSGGNLLLTNPESMNDNGVYQILDTENGEIRTGTGLEIIKDCIKELKYTKEDLGKVIRNTATKEQLKVEKQEFDDNDFLIGSKINDEYVCYDKSVLEYCILEGDKLIVEEASEVKRLDKDHLQDEVLAAVETLDVDNKAELTEQTLNFITDISTKDNDIAKYYDFLLMSQYNDDYRRKYIEKMRKNVEKRSAKIVEKAQIDAEEFSKMDDIEKILLFEKVEREQENNLDVAVYYEGLSKKKEAKATVQIMSLVDDIQQYKNYVLFNKVNNALEMKAQERDAKARMQKEMDQEASAIFKSMGVKEEVNIVMSYTEGENLKTIDGQERLMFDDNGKISIGTEHIRAKRNYEKAAKLDEEEETNDNEDMIDITNIFYGEDEETVSSEEMDQIELSTFIDMDGNDNEEEVEMSADSIELND